MNILKKLENQYSLFSIIMGSFLRRKCESDKKLSYCYQRF